MSLLQLFRHKLVFEEKSQNRSYEFAHQHSPSQFYTPAAQGTQHDVFAALVLTKSCILGSESRQFYFMKHHHFHRSLNTSFLHELLLLAPLHAKFPNH